MESLDDTLQRLKRERDEADRRYNDALTALDRALPAPASWPAPRIGYDESQLPALNSAWEILEPPAAGAGWRGRLAGFIWRVIAPSLQRQLKFNSRLVDHLNRSAAAEREAHASAEETADRLRDEFAKLAEFHTRTIHYLQQVTAYVDTRTRESEGGALVLNASLSGLAENMSKRWESLGARDRRAEAQTTALATSHEELRTMVGVAQQAALSLKRELDGLREVHEVHRVHEVHEVHEVPQVHGVRPPAFKTLDSYKYVGFEDQFRGSREEIRGRLESYVPVFAGASDVVDVGCGRGEFLELLAAAGVRARGIDINHEMVELCRARGLDVSEADAVGYRSTLPDASIGGLLAAQVVEHLQPDYLLAFLELAFHKLRPGGRIVLETLNPACWIAFFESYIRDITHVWPLHPETLKYLVLASGFSRADIEYRSPVPANDRLQRLAVPAAADTTLADLVEAINANTEKLNARIFTHLDYAVIGTR
jgi:SAM-dependent methyltransferase